ncbi:MAG: hypothetical protein HY094_04315 [Candidatus Melainabacteria bacterium]|nr:hypothetical protein [Candidatus Melainabacteria bacterium]
MVNSVKLASAFLAGTFPFLAQGYNEIKATTCIPKVQKLEEVPKINSPKDFYLFTYNKAKQKIKMELAPEKAIKEYYKRNNLANFENHIVELKDNVKTYSSFTSPLENHIFLKPKDKTSEIIPKDEKVVEAWAKGKDKNFPRGFYIIKSEPIKLPPGIRIDPILPFRKDTIDINSVAIRKYDGNNVLSFNMNEFIITRDHKRLVRDKIVVLPLDFNLVITKGDTAYVVTHKVSK